MEWWEYIMTPHRFPYVVMVSNSYALIVMVSFWLYIGHLERKNSEQEKLISIRDLQITSLEKKLKNAEAKASETNQSVASGDGGSLQETPIQSHQASVTQPTP